MCISRYMYNNISCHNSLYMMHLLYMITYDMIYSDIRDGGDNHLLVAPPPPYCLTIYHIIISYNNCICIINDDLI